jgi:hypothetical protein
MLLLLIAELRLKTCLMPPSVFDKVYKHVAMAAHDDARIFAECCCTGLAVSISGGKS